MPTAIEKLKKIFLKPMWLITILSALFKLQANFIETRLFCKQVTLNLAIFGKKWA